MLSRFDHTAQPQHDFPVHIHILGTVDFDDCAALQRRLAYDACTRAVARARAGEGPTLIEARTYRMGPHNTSDDPTRYVDPVELDEHRAFDPVERVRRHLTAQGLVDEASEQALVHELRAEVDAAFAEAQDSAAPGAEGIFDHVWARPPARFDDQRAAARRAAAPPGTAAPRGGR